MNGKTSGLFCAIAFFTDENGKPLEGKGWTATISDQDILVDECLGKARLDNDGHAKFLLSVADIKSLDSWGERTPDIYFTLFKDDVEIFRSEVFENVDFEALDEVSGDAGQITQEFGPFKAKP